MSEKQTLATKGLYFSGPPAFCDDGEDAMCLTFPDGHTVKYVPERTCRWSYDDATDSWDAECGGKVLWDHGAPKFCPECGGTVVEE